jgi:hypothetical protein
MDRIDERRRERMKRQTLFDIEENRRRLIRIERVLWVLLCGVLAAVLGKLF